MSDHINPFTGIPAEWIPLISAPRLLEEHFDLEQRFTANSIRQRLQDGQMIHRIAGLQRTDLRISAAYGSVIDPPGLACRGGLGFVTVEDWEKALVEWLTGTVAGPKTAAGRKRCAIELLWRQLEEFASIWKAEIGRALVARQTSPAKLLPRGEREAVATAWMRGFALGYNDRGAKPTRDPAVKLCVQENSVSHRVALAAWNALPDHLKNQPRRAIP